MIRESIPRDKVARELMIAPTPVTNICRDNDRAFDRSATKDASAAREVWCGMFRLRPLGSPARAYGFLNRDTLGQGLAPARVRLPTCAYAANRCIVCEVSTAFTVDAYQRAPPLAVGTA